MIYLNKADAIEEFITVDYDKIKEIENSTRDQSKSTRWFSERTPRTTASKCKRALLKETTSPTKAMKEILGYNKHYESILHEGWHQF